MNSDLSNTIRAVPAGHRSRHGPRPLGAGLALVELMIALALGLVIIAALAQLYVGGKQSSVLSDAMGRLDESGRFALDFLAIDVRMAGYLSCGGESARVANSVNAVSSWPYSTRGIEGYEGGVSTPPSDFTGQYRAGTDILIVRRATLDLERSVIQDDSASGIMKLGLDHRFQVGEILVISNPSCTQASLFQVTGVLNLDHLDQTTKFDAIKHDPCTPGGSGTCVSVVSPGNCTRLLFGAFDCSNNSVRAESGVFRAGSVVSRFAAHAYYLSAADPPTLMRKRLSVLNGQATIITEEIIRNVENFQVLYGRDTTADNNHRVDDYVTANEVTEWATVVSVRLVVVLRSAEENVRAVPARFTYSLFGTTVTVAADRRLRRSLDTVIALRNNAP